MHIAIYDMDRTITQGGTWLPWLMFWLRRQAPWRAALLPLAGVAAAGHGLGLVSRGGLKAAVHRVVMGRRVPRARVEAMAAAFAAHIVATHVFPGALAQIAADRAAGKRLVLATASCAYYAEAIGALLGFDAVVATPSRWQGDRLDWRLGGPNCYGPAKRNLVAAWLAAHGGTGALMTVYSDHMSDVPLFDLAVQSGGTAVAANASPALRGHAVAQGWRIVDWGVPKTSLFERA